MTKYFFDVRTAETVGYDYAGRWMPGIDDARETAELLALDISCTRLDQSQSALVEERDQFGNEILRIQSAMKDAVAL